MSRGLIALLVCAAVLLGGLFLGIFGAVGVCTAIWSPECIEPILGASRDRNHPANWVFLCLGAPDIFVGVAGMMVVFFWPLCYFFPWLPSAFNMPEHLWFLRWQRRRVEAWARHLDAEIDRLEKWTRPASRGGSNGL
jgi:hypothetical protein